MYVYMYSCIHIYTYIYVRVWPHIRRVNLHPLVVQALVHPWNGWSVCMCIWMVSMHVYMDGQYACVYSHSSIHTYIHTYMCVYACGFFLDWQTSGVKTNIDLVRQV